MCMCFLLLDDELSATALLPEAERIKNTYTDGTGLYAYAVKYARARQHIIKQSPSFLYFQRP